MVLRAPPAVNLRNKFCLIKADVFVRSVVGGRTEAKDPVIGILHGALELVVSGQAVDVTGLLHLHKQSISSFDDDGIGQRCGSTSLQGFLAWQVVCFTL